MPSTKTRPSELVVTIVLIEFISGFTQGYYEPLIPKFGDALGVDASSLTLFNVIPTAVAAIFVPVLTRLGDIFGYRKLLRVVVPLVFAATVLIYLGASVGSWPLVLFGRLLNGPIAVWLPLHIALVHAKTSGKSASRAVAVIVAVLTVGTVVGTGVSGFVFGALGGLANTVLVVPFLQAIAVFLVFAVMPEFISGANRHIDYLGFALLALIMIVTILSFVVIPEGSTSTIAGIVGLIAAGIVSFFWYRYEKRTKNPAIDVRLLFSRSLGPIYLAAIAFGAVFYGWLSPWASYLAADPVTDGYGYGFSAAQISLTQTLYLGVTVLAALLVPVIVSRLGAKVGLGLGFVLAAGSFIQWALFPTGIAKLGVLILGGGLGFGVISAAIPVIIPTRAPQGTHGIATGLFNSSQTLGGALGGSLLGAVLTVGARPDGTISETGFSTVWWASAGILLLGFLTIAALLYGNSRSDTSSSSPKTNDNETIESTSEAKHV